MSALSDSFPSPSSSSIESLSSSFSPSAPPLSPPISPPPPSSSSILRRALPPLLLLPPELLLCILDHLPRIPDLHSLALTHPTLSSLILPYLLPRYITAWNTLHTSPRSPLNSGPSLPRSHATHTPLHTGLKTGNLSLIRAFHSSINFYPNALTGRSSLLPSPPLLWAVLKDETQMVEELLEKYVQKFYKAPVPSPSLLLFAVVNGNCDIAEKLLKSGWSTSQSNFSGYRWAPLQLAVWKGDEAMIKTLIRGWSGRKRWIANEVVAWGFEGWKGRVEVGDLIAIVEGVNTVVYEGREGRRRGRWWVDVGEGRELDRLVEVEMERAGRKKKKVELDHGNVWDRAREREQRETLGRCVIRPGRNGWIWIAVFVVLVGIWGGVPA